jgi:hypothetical protein
VTALNEKGIPTPLAATMMRAPMSRMDILSQSEIDSINRSSDLVRKYSETIDRQSAFELLTGKIDSIQKQAEEEAYRKEREKERWGDGGRRTSGSSRRGSVLRNPVVKVLTSATFIRGVFGIMKKVIKL